MNLILTFHTHRDAGDKARMSPSAYFMDTDYVPVAVRIYAEIAPLRDAKFDIFDDGVSIFSNKVNRAWNLATGVEITGTADTTVGLAPNQSCEEMAEVFTGDTISEDSWIYCNLVDAGGGENFTVQLELSPLTEE